MEPKRPTLDEVLAWQQPDVVASFVKTFALPQDEAQDIFRQMKAMLWLMNEMDHDGMRENGRRFGLDRSLVVVDEMWHQFILYTKNYQQFCQTLFGQMMHHFPTTEAERQATALAMAGLSDEHKARAIMDDKRWQYTYVYQKLGKDTFVKWYVTYHQQYTPRKLAEYRLQAIVAQENAPSVSEPAMEANLL
jgi:acyl-CoA thioesterase FadM